MSEEQRSLRAALREFGAAAAGSGYMGAPMLRRTYIASIMGLSLELSRLTELLAAAPLVSDMPYSDIHQAASLVSAIQHRMKASTVLAARLYRVSESDAADYVWIDVQAPSETKVRLANGNRARESQVRRSGDS